MYTIRRALVLLFLAFSSVANLPFTEAKSPHINPFSVEITKRTDGIVVNFTIEPGYYLYRDRIKLNNNSVLDLPHDKVIEVVGERFEVLQQPFTIKLLQSGTLSWQGCAESGFCYPPGAIVISNGQTAWSWLSFFSIGLLLSLTPCVLPLLPITLASIKGRLIIIRALFYGAGITAGYSLIGLLFAFTGQYTTGASDLMLRVILAMMLIALSAVQLEIVHLKNLGWQNVINGIQKRISQFGFTGVFFMGALSSFAVSPCLTPGLAGALTLLKNASIYTSTLSMALVGSGLAIPLVLVSIFGRSILPKAGKWQPMLNRAIALALIFIAFDLIFSYFSFENSLAVRISIGIVLATLMFSTIAWSMLAGIISLNIAIMLLPTPSYDAKIELISDLAKYPNAFISVSADWCRKCHVLEKALSRSDSFNNYRQKHKWIKLDITCMTAEQQNWLRDKGIFGPPAFLWQNEDNSQNILIAIDSIEPIIEKLPKEY